MDYALSLWFSPTIDKVIPGTAFLFLNKVVFVWASVFFSVTGILNLQMKIGFYVGILVSVGALIMYGFQKKMEVVIRAMSLENDQITKRMIVWNRILGLFYFAASFLLIFLVVSIFH
jgi:hypothetical protein